MIATRLRAERLGAKAWLVLEILRAYVQLHRLMRSQDITVVMAQARQHSVTQTGKRRTFRAPLPPAAPLQTALYLGHAVGRTLGPLPTDSRCLIQSVVLTRLLSDRDIPSRVVIGARPEPAFAAHAWVECDGNPVSPVGEFAGSRLVEL